jgi:TRAP-type C4-dicarboxylate transport system substrate-binding protein
MTKRIPLASAVPLAAAFAAVTTLSACTAVAPTPDPPLVLTLATDDSPDYISADQITAFAEHVAELSDGAIEVSPDWNSNNDIGHDWDQAAAQLVIDGSHELGLVPSRAWDVLGVTSLQALSVPMLITDRSLEVAVITDQGITSELLKGLDEVGITGLSLYPEELRRPFGFSEALVEPDQFAGAAVRVPTSAASTLLYEMLGGTAVDDEPDPAVQLGLDSDFDRAPRSIASGNLVWYPKVNVLIANSAAWDALTDVQRDVLQQAAATAQQDAIDTLPDESTAARIWCGSTGGTIVGATADQLAAFEAATTPVRDHLATDPATKALIADIEALKDTTPPDQPTTACPR